MSILLENLSQERIKQLCDDIYWYHTITWLNGLKTDGAFDHTPHLDKFGFPESLAGKTALDVGTSDGFFAFELEKRGASVKAVDILKYDGSLGFDAAPKYRENFEKKYEKDIGISEEFSDVSELLGIPYLDHFLVNGDLVGSQAEYENRSIYELTDMGQTFDFVYCGDLISHLKDPIVAAENLAAVTDELCIVGLHRYTPIPENRPQRAERIVKAIARRLNVDYLIADINSRVDYVSMARSGEFYQFTPQSFRQLLLTSGFKDVKIHAQVDYPNIRNQSMSTRMVYHCYK